MECVSGSSFTQKNEHQWEIAHTTNLSVKPRFVLRRSEAAQFRSGSIKWWQTCFRFRLMVCAC